jgi:acetate kinase
MKAAAEPLIGVINAGSSSLKFSFYEGDQQLLAGQVDGIGVQPRASATGPDGKPMAPPELGRKPATTPSELLPAIIPWAREHFGDRRLAALGHRVVHGGLRHSRPARVTPELLAELESLVPLAPLHEPHNLAPIKMALQLNPDLPQLACFDTAFHRTAPEVEQAFALPYSFYQEGIRRYGFHGLSYEYIASVLPQRAPEIANGRVVVAHLGNGCSACALQNRVSIATTMGFTALDGLPMGTRCGELDAGVVLHLISRVVHPISANYWPAASHARISRSRCSATASPATSPRSLRHSAVSTGSCSPPGSAKTRHPFAPTSVAPAPGSGWSWTRRPTGNTRSG